MVQRPPQANTEKLRKAGLRPTRQRLALDEFVELQLAIQTRRRRLEANARALPCSGDNHLIKPFLSRLGFPLTGAQTRVLRDIRHDMGMGGEFPGNAIALGKQMTRLEVALKNQIKITKTRNGKQRLITVAPVAAKTPSEPKVAAETKPEPVAEPAKPVVAFTPLNDKAPAAEQIDADARRSLKPFPPINLEGYENW